MSKLQNEFVQIVTTKIVQVYCVGFEAQIAGQAGANCESKQDPLEAKEHPLLTFERSRMHSFFLDLAHWGFCFATESL